MKMLQPAFKLWNKSFKDSNVTLNFGKNLSVFAEKLHNLVNIPESPISAFIFDDLFVWFRSLGFLKNVEFINAVSNYSVDPIVMSKIWRIWILASTLASVSNRDGDIADIGTYDGKSFLIALRFCLLRKKNCLNSGYSALLYDAFENPPKEAKKSNHGKELFNKVCELFKSYPYVIAVKGYVPESCFATQSKLIKWAQIDLNSAEADCNAFKYVLPRLTSGALVIFDDYGFARYSETQKSLDKFVETNKLNPIIELPTGQGLYIHS